MEGPRAAPQQYLGLVLEELRRVVAALPEDMKPGPNPFGFPWELVICAAVVGFFAVLFVVWRSFQSVSNQLFFIILLYMDILVMCIANILLSGLIEEKCKLLEKFSLVQKEYEGLESSLKDASFENESTEAQSLEFVEGSQISEATYEKLNRFKSKLEDEICCLEKELKEEKSKYAEQDELMADISKTIQSLEDESKSLKSQVAEAKTTFKIFQMNEERLKIAIKDALNENSQLQESQKQLLQEAEVWKEQVSELNKQKVTFEDSKVHAEQVLNDKENHIKSLTERLLKMKDWAAVLGEDIMDDDNLELEMKSESENGAHLDDRPKGTLKKLIHAAKLNASLKTLEGERNQIYTQLSEVDKTKEELTERIKNLQTEQASLQSENAQFESENQKLQQKLKVMTELYQENEMKLHRHSPYGPSPLGRPSSETRAFLSPPTLLEGPLRLSPLLPGGGGRGSRGPGNPLDHQITNERGESNCDRLTDPLRAPSDTGSLSPPWEQDRRMMIPRSGQTYPDPALPPQRRDRFYSNSGRLSGPAELRSFNMPSLDKMDGPVSSEMGSSRNDTKDDLGNLNVPDSSLPAESEATGPGFVPPPLPPMRGPLFPVDTRGSFMRRGLPFPPPPPGNMYGTPRGYFSPRDFPGIPPPPFATFYEYAITFPNWEGSQPAISGL
ncbi:PREDICTED: cTAGE family member 5 [Propithecus coquereli]|uniref:cTAGE family member 5 n=1 Tax=Propithecus coquereli TaxID=379532 RepID=UPI00063ED5D0|nr:PREDICTED: cTAGE family member 5 [Propithecus coquereli]